MSEIEPPLYVDLDGSLVACDTLKHSLRLLMKRAPYLLPLLPALALSGRARFKKVISALQPIDATCLPFRPLVLSYLSEQKRSGRHLVLATGADQDIARRVSDHLGIFDDVIASDGKTNLTGKNKLEKIRLKTPVFDYIGDSSVDLPIFRAARKFFIVGRTASLLTSLPDNLQPERIFE